ncbi:hypothetical protein GPL15_19020 [Clostridium sp. MCC353]|uniref:hypothetical protein n=1 Tax=Clostridium sp. MCC353 TaxID=2592646 RepID=UPI001C017FB6|nr:hypothetical protein [Clostridium sp. MCC353]MBT9778593.1 hypothetical protein [Clostridium sp. MCC353]
MVDTMEKCREIEESIKKAEQELLRNAKMTSYGAGRMALIPKFQELDKTVDRKLVVLVDGLFASGKRSLIHALIGEELLPNTLLSAEPFYELHYGKEKKVIAYPEIMLMYGKEASNRKQEIDRQHYTIPNQRPKDKHCGKI